MQLGIQKTRRLPRGVRVGISCLADTPEEFRRALAFVKANAVSISQNSQCGSLELLTEERHRWQLNMLSGAKTRVCKERSKAKWQLPNLAVTQLLKAEKQLALYRMRVSNAKWSRLKSLAQSRLGVPSGDVGQSKIRRTVAQLVAGLNQLGFAAGRIAISPTTRFIWLICRSMVGIQTKWLNAAAAKRGPYTGCDVWILAGKAATNLPKTARYFRVVEEGARVTREILPLHSKVSDSSNLTDVCETVFGVETQGAAPQEPASFSIVPGDISEDAEFAELHHGGFVCLLGASPTQADVRSLLDAFAIARAQNRCLGPLQFIAEAPIGFEISALIRRRGLCDCVEVRSFSHLREVRLGLSETATIIAIALTSSVALQIARALEAKIPIHAKYSPDFQKRFPKASSCIGWIHGDDRFRYLEPLIHVDSANRSTSFGAGEFPWVGRSAEDVAEDWMNLMTRTHESEKVLPILSRAA
ncbi:MAG: hypothetical protein ACE361_16105 [Aureliella sp.]